MIKLLWFRDDAGSPPSVPSLLAERADVAPVRMTSNIVLEAEHRGTVPHSAIDLAYFEDVEHLERYRQAIGADDGEGPVGVALITDEVVLRGQDWLTDRWTDDRPRFKHIALARRADGLTPSDFAERWRAHAGAAGSVPIPPELRGQAYVQNHPISDPGAVHYDAVNEVWFDDLDVLRERHRWMAENLPPASDDDLFGDRHLLLVEETLLPVPHP